MLAEAGLFGEHLLSIISVLQIADKRREEKGKAKRERYTQLNAEIQRTGRRDKRAFLSEHCKEIEENNRMEKTRNLFKKTGDIKGTFHVRKRRIKDRNGKDLTEAEGIKNGQEYTEELYIKDSNDLDNHKCDHLRRASHPGV